LFMPVKNIFKLKKIPFRQITFNKKNENELGEIFTFFVLETILLSRLMNIDPFDQPAVEEVKIETKKIFVLHSKEYRSDSTNNYGSFSISQDYNILFEIAKNKGPDKSLVILGYSGWGSGQLEGEMERDHWILSDIDLDITFDQESNTKWNKAYKNSFIKI